MPVLLIFCSSPAVRGFAPALSCIPPHLVHRRILQTEIPNPPNPFLFPSAQPLAPPPNTSTTIQKKSEVSSYPFPVPFTPVFLAPKDSLPHASATSSPLSLLIAPRGSPLPMVPNKNRWCCSFLISGNRARVRFPVCPFELSCPFTLMDFFSGYPLPYPIFGMRRDGGRFCGVSGPTLLLNPQCSTCVCSSPLFLR